MSARKPFLSPHRKKKAQERRRYYMWWVVGIAIVIGMIVGLAAWGSGHSNVTIQNITINGNESVGADEIQQVAFGYMEGRYVYLFDKHNIFLYPKEKIYNAILNTFPRLNTVDISFESLNSISIDVTEREVASLWCGETQPEVGAEVLDSCYFMDDTGFIFAKSPHFSGNVYFEWFGKPQKHTVEEGAQFVSETEFIQLQQLKNGIGALDFTPHRLVVGTSTPKYTIHLENDGRIFADDIHDVSFLLDTLESALPELDRSKQLDYIDLRFGNKVFYKYNNSG